jgi:DNA (cytosine-5)-methyltransferase 1
VSAYYNEIDPFAAQWLRELIKAGLIAPGDVDGRSIEDVTPNDLRGYSQCHFFAGIGGWSYALRLAGRPDDRPVWTGSCPCQPFSAAGKGKGFADERHLWPSWYWLIQQCRPAIVFGEQVASKATNVWFNLVQADLEALGYAFGVVPFPAASLGAPHIRDRAYWVADSTSPRHNGQKQDTESYPRNEARLRLLGEECEGGGLANTAGAERSWEMQEPRRKPAISGEGEPDRRCGNVGRLGNSTSDGWDARRTESSGFERVATSSGTFGMADSERNGGGTDEPGRRQERRGADGRDNQGACGDDHPMPTNGFWRDADWLFCRDGKWRPVEPGTFTLAHGVSQRVGRLRGYGNAIVAPQAAEFIKTVMEAKS